MSATDSHASGRTSEHLATVQRWFLAVITHPDGVDAGAASREAQTEVALQGRGLEQVVTKSRRLSANERLSVYSTAYHSRLIECLADSFPALKRAFGDELFDGFALDYLRRYPSRSYTLARLGERFPRFLQETRPDRDPAAPPTEFPPVDWPDLVIDLATLECAIEDVFDGPGIEGEPGLRLDDLLQIPTERRTDIRLRTAPCFRLLGFRYPINEYYTALRSGREPVEIPRPEPAESFLALTRHDFVVRRHDLSRVQFELLEALERGEPVRMAIARAATICELEDEAFAARLRDWFTHWAQARFFSGLIEG